MVYDSQTQSVIATWDDETTRFPYAAISTDGGSTWGSPITVTSGSAVLYNALTSYNPNSGSLIATWADKTTSAPMSATSNDGGRTWKVGPVQISPKGAQLDVVSLFVPTKETILASWGDQNSGLPTVAISKNNGRNWGAPQVISSTIPVFGNVYTSIDPNTGTIIAVWTGVNDFLPYYSLSNNGGRTWSEALTIPNSNPVGSQINVTFDPIASAFVLVWANGPDLSPQYAMYTITKQESGEAQ
jgi:Neuraminidase (sialidase)